MSDNSPHFLAAEHTSTDENHVLDISLPLMASEEVDQRLQKLKEKEKQLKAQIQAAEARVKEKQRKVETRQKIILGGAVLSLLKNEKNEAFKQQLLAKLNAIVTREADRKTLGLSWLCCSTQTSGLLKLFRQIYSFEACPTT
ncbi:hypothetical protein [Zooshikella ganghwensis]|nr:hypothetical protein [Zooshikella ganghwensis]